MDTYHRRLRKPQPAYGDDAAGLVCGSKFQGRKTPLKGKGTPPPDNYEPQFHPSKRVVPGKSHYAAKDLLHHQQHERSPNPMAMSMDSGMLALAKQGMSPLRPQSASGGRACLKLCENSFRSSLQGSGLAVISEVPVHRPIRKPGTAAPTSATKARVLVLAEDVAPPPEWETTTPRDAHLRSAWERQSVDVGCLSRALERPSTAPPKMVHEARRRYHETHTGANLDLFHYRHSGGICPDDYRTDDARSPAPQLASPGADAAREAFFASRLGYAQNRVRAKISEPAYA